MKLIGHTPDRNFLVEMTDAEYKTLVKLILALGEAPAHLFDHTPMVIRQVDLSNALAAIRSYSMSLESAKDLHRLAEELENAIRTLEPGQGKVMHDPRRATPL